MVVPGKLLKFAYIYGSFILIKFDLMNLEGTRAARLCPHLLRTTKSFCTISHQMLAALGVAEVVVAITIRADLCLLSQSFRRLRRHSCRLENQQESSPPSDVHPFPPTDNRGL